MNREIPLTDREIMAFARRRLGTDRREAWFLDPVAAGASDRVYWRLRGAPAPVLVMRYGAERPENLLFVSIARFLRRREVPVPEVLAHDPVRRLVLLEDLGHRDLWSYRGETWETRRVLYERTISAVARLHAIPPDAPAREGITLMEGFGPDLYRWERRYFLERFVRDLCRVTPDPGEQEAVEEELAALARRVHAGGECLIHRDLQSQNVMIRDGRPVLVDFQGMRRGSLFYDFGSLLYDPYVDLRENEREELAGLCLDALPGGVSRDGGRAALRDASVQRLLQALGAYGFIGLTQGRREYLAHVRTGVANLEGLLREAAGFPRLRALLDRCRSSPSLLPFLCGVHTITANVRR